MLDMTNKTPSAVERAIAALNPPTQAHLARITNKKRQEITRWINRGVVPAKYAALIAAATGVSSHDLCPSLPVIPSFDNTTLTERDDSRNHHKGQK